MDSKGDIFNTLKEMDLGIDLPIKLSKTRKIIEQIARFISRLKKQIKPNFLMEFLLFLAIIIQIIYVPLYLSYDFKIVNFVFTLEVFSSFIYFLRFMHTIFKFHKFFKKKIDLEKLEKISKIKKISLFEKLINEFIEIFPIISFQIIISIPFCLIFDFYEIKARKRNFFLIFLQMIRITDTKSLFFPFLLIKKKSLGNFLK